MKYKWGDLITLEYGKPVKDKDSKSGNIPVFGTNGQIGTSHLPPLCPHASFILGRKGAYRGVHYSDVPFSVIDTAFYAKNIRTDILSLKWAYYKFLTYDINRMNSGSAIPSTDRYEIYGIEVELPPIKYQQKIVCLLEFLNKKIELNNRINDNLEQQVLALYNERFVSTINRGRRTCRVDEFFDISIGKTPPRKEPQWFSINLEDITWVSISDMASCGLYISSSSEQLTAEAVEKHNVKIVPDNTVLLSFKLTVGRIAITDGEMTTNEAIAHFKTNNKVINEYLYCYLRLFNYQTMGSTSSIATAVNSKIIKAMPFVIPTNEELTEFHSLAAPMFALIKSNQREIERLSSLRDTFLPKLMSGEIDVSNIQL